MNATNTALNNSGFSGQESDVGLSIPPTPQKQKRKHQQQSSISSIEIKNEDPRFYDMPRQLQPPGDKNNQKWTDSNLNSSLERGGTPPLQSPTDSESVFTTDDELTHPMPLGENGLRQPLPSDSSIEMEPSSWSVVQRFGKLQVVDSPNVKSNDLPASVSIVGAPPRPPKPSHLGKVPSYSPTASRLKAGAREQVDLIGHITTDKTTPIPDTENKDNVQGQPITDEMYDFPRSHVVNEPETSKQILSTRHCYNNAAPSNVEGHVFRYDITATEAIASSDQAQFDGMQDEEPASPCSQSSSSTTAMYSNLPSPLLADFQSGPGGPPVVNRCLKPGRKLSDSASICSLPEPSSPRSAPNVDRKLKPSASLQVRKPNDLEVEHGSLRLPRAAPSPTPPSFTSSKDDIFDDEPVYFYDHRQFLGAPRASKEFEKLQYIDLDLELADAALNGSLNSSQPPRSPGQPTVYKTVDFVKTEAFKRTRQCVEEERQKCSVEP